MAFLMRLSYQYLSVSGWCIEQLQIIGNNLTAMTMKLVPKFFLGLAVFISSDTIL